MSTRTLLVSLSVVTSQFVEYQIGTMNILLSIFYVRPKQKLFDFCLFVESIMGGDPIDVFIQKI